jgi:hypothetical protein
MSQSAADIHSYDFIRSMGLDPVSSASVSTPLDPNVLFSKADCPPIIDEIKERILRAHDKQIHIAIWARPDLAHWVSVLGRYVHNPSKRHLNAYLRVARYLINLDQGPPHRLRHARYPRCGFSDSDWGADPDSYRSTGAYIFFSDGAACCGRSNSAALRSYALKKVNTSRDLRLPRNLSISACSLSTLVLAILVPPTSMWTTRGLLLWAFTQQTRPPLDTST